MAARKNLIFRPLVIIDSQIFLTLFRACHAYAFLIFMSSSVLSIQEPQYLKSSFLSGSAPSLIIITSGLIDAVGQVFCFLYIYYEAYLFTFDLHCNRSSLAWFRRSDSRAISSAKFRYVREAIKNSMSPEKINSFSFAQKTKKLIKETLIFLSLVFFGQSFCTSYVNAGIKKTHYDHDESV